MKSILNNTLILITFLSFMMLGFTKLEKQKASFKVWGNCNMCQEKITSTVKSINGVKWVSWNVKTKILSVKFDNEKVSLNAIHKKIASIGYDTEHEKASEEAYNKLHYCCQYDRE